MPLYEYRCEDCEESTDLHMAMSGKRPKVIECEYCGGVAHRIFSVGASYIKKTYVGDIWDKADADPHHGNKKSVRNAQSDRIKRMREQSRINAERKKRS